MYANISLPIATGDCEVIHRCYTIDCSLYTKLLRVCFKRELFF